MSYIPAACIEILEARIAPAIATTLTWQGDLASTGWDDGTLNTNTNWLSNLNAHRIPVDGNILVFPAGAGSKFNNNDISGLDLKSLSFTGDGYSISGNAITLSGGITANYTTTVGNSIFIPITLAADQTFAFSGNTTSQFSLGLIDLGGKTLTVDSTFNVEVGSGGSKLTGAGAVIKNGPGTLVISGGNDFTGPVLVSAGILRALGNGSAFGAAGAGNGTTVGSGAALVLQESAAYDVDEDFTLSGAGTAAQPGAIVLRGIAGVGPIATLLGAVRLGADATISGDPASSDQLILAGAVGAADDALAILTINSASLSNFAFANTATFTTELAGLTPGASGHDQLKVIGPVDLGSATLNVVPSFTPQVGAKFTIVDNDGTDAITGTFAGLAEGANVFAGGVVFTISYKGLDGATGNDVVLTVTGFSQTPGTIDLTNGGKTATFVDVDGDIVTVKTTKGPFQQDDFRLAVAGSGAQLQQLNLTTHPDDFIGANFTITAKPGSLGGNGFVNVGYLNATGIDLGVVKISGDLGRINAGTVGGDVKVPGLKSLTVGSLGLLGSSTQAAGGSPGLNVEGALPKLTVKGDLRTGVVVQGVTDGKLGSVVIGGTYTTDGGNSRIEADAGIGSIKIGGDIRNIPGSGVRIQSDTSIGSIDVAGSIVGTEVSNAVRIRAFGKATAPISGLDTAIGSVKVGGSVEFARIEASGNADATFGSITVGGDWIASSAKAGINEGSDAMVGTNDDVKISGGRDNPAIVSSIGSFTVKGQALGTGDSTSDMFGIVAEKIGKAKVGTRTFAFTNGATPEAFFAAPTLDGAGTENPLFDFTIREFGSTTPTVALGGPNLILSPDGKTATFTDVDGDLVTVQRNLGAFVLGDFTLSTAASGGALFQALTVTPAPNSLPVNLSITAKVGPAGGNGFVNVGPIDAGQTDLGVVVIDGELQDLDTGDNDAARPGLASLTVHSLGSVAGTAPTGDEINSARGIGKITVQTDVRHFHIFANSSDTGNLGSITIGGSMHTSEIQAAANIGKVKIGGSFLGDSRIQATERIGTISIGGDLVGAGGTSATIEAFAQDTGPANGLDLALKSLTVKGSVEKMNVILGRNNNADASLGAISVGRAWLASSVLAGIEAGVDTFIGTSDDQKVSQGGPTDLTRFSTIASIVIKGQAIGTAAAGDSFGIVAEQILKAKIGTRTFKFDKGARDAADAFAGAPTGPGPAPDNALSDFFIREITV